VPRVDHELARQPPSWAPFHIGTRAQIELLQDPCRKPSPPSEEKDPMSAAVEPGAPTKDCPFCGEEVKEVAKKCKHCGETIDVALRSAEEAMRMAQAANSNGNVYMNAAAAVAPVVLVKPRGSYFLLIMSILLFWPYAIWYWAKHRWSDE
jgi:hypothetical protein